MRIRRNKLVLDDGTEVAFHPSPNRGGSYDPRYLVMHFTAGRSAQESIDWLCAPEAKASAHVVVGRDGAVTQLVPFDRVAWHAGRSRWQGLVGLNQYAIGIELDNAGKLERRGDGWYAWWGGKIPDAEVVEGPAPNDDSGRIYGWQTYTEPQLEAALSVARTVVRKYDLLDIIGHSDIAPGRKVDPGPAFPMASFRARVLGRADDEPVRYRATAALNIRTGPGTQHDKLPQSPLAAGTVVEPVRTQDPWWLVKVEGAEDADLQGWVHSHYLEQVA